MKVKARIQKEQKNKEDKIQKQIQLRKKKNAF